jgi:hypothetical protein
MRTASSRPARLGVKLVLALLAPLALLASTGCIFPLPEPLLEPSPPGVDGGEEAQADAGHERLDYAARVLADGPIAYWRFEESPRSAATTVTDASGSGHHGTAANVERVAGREGLGAAGVFNGLNSTISVPHHDDFNLGQAITLEAWIRTTDASGRYRAVLGKYDHGPRGYDLLIKDGRIRVAVRGTSSIDTAEVAGGLNDGAWHHVVATCDGTSLRVYIDGVDLSAASGTWDATFETAPLLIGSRAHQFHWEGELDEVALYDRVLSPEAVKAHFDAASPMAED